MLVRGDQLDVLSRYLYLPTYFITVYVYHGIAREFTNVVHQGDEVHDPYATHF